MHVRYLSPLSLVVPIFRAQKLRKQTRHFTVAFWFCYFEVESMRNKFALYNVILSEATLAPHAHLPRMQVLGSAGENLYRYLRDPSLVLRVTYLKYVRQLKILSDRTL
jgi:hypothetical protein